jgi:hypothetical protein
MRKLAIALTAGAVLAIGVTVALAEIQATYVTSATGSKANGTKKQPKSFSGSWTMQANSAIPGDRPPPPNYWEWSWEGVVANQKGVPVCTAASINNASSETVCPAGSKVGQGPNLVASLGPSANTSPQATTACLGKQITAYNGGPGLMTFAIDGPATSCAGLGFLGAFDVTLTTAGGKTTFRWTQPDNLTHPLGAGTSGTLNSGTMSFPVTKAATKKKVKHFYLESVACKGKTRSFTYTVSDEFGVHTNTSTAGKCVQPKKK